MAHITINSIFTAHIIVIDVVLQLPIEAGNGLIVVVGGVSTIILKVVSIDT